MSWFASGPGLLGVTAAKAALMYMTALGGLRLSSRRTVAQWSTLDFAAAAALGAIVGRTAVARTQTYAVGAVALVTILVVHRIVGTARASSAIRRLTDHRVRVLVANGRPQPGELRRSALTEDDLFAELRQRGITSLTGVRFVIFEPKGGLTVVPEQDSGTGELLDRALSASRSCIDRVDSPGSPAARDGS